MSLLYQFLGYTPENYNRVSPAQYELLICLTRQQVDDNLLHSWTPIVGSLEHNIALFCSEGLIEEASLEEKFDSKFRVSDIKSLLDKHSISVNPKARKSEMIARYLDSIPLTAAAGEVADIRLYRATGEGKKRLEFYLAQKEMARKTMEASAMAYLMNGDLTRAGQRIALHETQQIFPRGPGIDWSKGMPEACLRMAAYILSNDYSELPMLESQRKEVGAKLALSALLGETYADAGKRILDTSNGEFGWTVFGNVLRTNSCCGYAATCNLDDPLEIAQLYARMRMSEACTNMDLEKLATTRLGKGIKILPANGNHCISCTRGKHQYSWSEIQSLPRLPRQWGCLCTYSAWI
ncbi:MAG TPA: hypothetical protein VMC84_01500 [Methanocella sp.]|uniref:hypothetical protein n=1 Tax=Methanocella sp. TaxID=2052833 RepID=UPI002CB350ED|nr:hypothetical protein [Methanocella sp.]HTY89829.1 hypothetical protein [Methanocella sp.]